METTTHPQTSAALLNDSRVQASFSAVKNCFKLYGVLSTVALGIIITVAATGHTVNTFMWVRGILLPAIAALLFGMTAAGARGSRRTFERVRAVTLIEPIAIIGVDLIPGVCPTWYAIVQAVCMLPVIAAAFLTRGPALRSAFPKTR